MFILKLLFFECDLSVQYKAGEAPYWAFWNKFQMFVLFYFVYLHVLYFSWVAVA